LREMVRIAGSDQHTGDPRFRKAESVGDLCQALISAAFDQLGERTGFVEPGRIGLADANSRSR
jgi:hypothetical protein